MNKRKPNRKSWITQQLRRLSLRWPPRGRALKASRRELPRKIKKDGTPYKKANYEYQCNICKEWFRNKDIELDHINPVVDVKSEAMSEEEFYSTFIMGLFCYEDNFQVVCSKCHTKKSKKENKTRKITKKCKKS